MATFTVTSVARCAGGNHIEITVTIGGQTVVVQTTPEELQGLAADNRDELRRLGLLRMRSAILEAGATTPAQQRNALVGKTFQV